MVEDSAAVLWKAVVAAPLGVHLHPTRGLCLLYSLGCSKERKPAFNFGQEHQSGRWDTLAHQSGGWDTGRTAS